MFNSTTPKKIEAGLPTRSGRANSHSAKSSLTVRKHNASLNEQEKLECKTELASNPLTVVIPTGSVCNLQCVFCTDRSSTSPYRYRNLNFDEFLCYADVLHWAMSVGLYGWGEPLANPDYERIFEYVVNEHYGIEIYVTTNGVLLDAEWGVRFVDYKRTRLTVSVNAATSQTYKKIMGLDRFDRVVSNIRNFVELRNNRVAQTPTLTLSFLSMTSNIRELPDFVELAADLSCDSVLIQDLKILEEGQNSYSLHHDPALARECFEDAKARAGTRGIDISIFRPVSYFGSNENVDCFEPWESFRISENGDVFACCYSHYVMGNVLTQSVDDIWNGEGYRYYRRTVNSGTPPEECRQCTKKMSKDIFASHKWNRTQSA